jgi:hypothetical protein
MSLLLSLLIVAIGPSAPTEARYPEAVKVFHCTFGPQSDQNYDTWPDDWSRKRGPGYPRYLPIRLSAEPTPVGKYCVRMDLDGGGAVAYSPPIEARWAYDYVLEGLVETEGLVRDHAWLSLTFLDKDQRQLRSFASEKIGQSQGWQKLSLGPVEYNDEKVQWVIIGLHLEPENEADLKGTARFDDLWLGRLPRIALTTDQVVPFYTDPKEITVRCRASGFEEEGATVTFQVEDSRGTVLANQSQPLQSSPAASSEPEKAGHSKDREPVVRSGSTEWKPPITGLGFYRILATMKGRQSPLHRPSLALAVIRPKPPQAASEFGWTLPRGNKSLPLPRLAELVGQAGVGWVKYPLWYDAKSFPAQINDLIQFSEQLANQGIELVGLLTPPESLCKQVGYRYPASAVETFLLEPKVWYPSLESTMARMATQVRWWQLGDDRDASFVDYRAPAERVAQVKGELDRIGHDVNVGLGWSWNHAMPQVPEGSPPWRFLALSANPPLSPQRLATALESTRQSPVRRWVVIDPPPAGSQALEARVLNLVEQLLAAKIHGADGIFLADPFDPDRGLINADGTPNELFLPWRTTALMLGGASYLGSIDLPGESQNYLFARSDEAVMVVWNDKPKRETVYLGQDVRQVDLGGRIRTLEKQESGQVVDVGPLPTFLVGLDMAVTRWRQDFSFAKTQLASIPGVPQANLLRIKNPLERPVGGKLRLTLPEGWTVDPPEIRFHLDRGQTLEQPLQITLSASATCGRQRVRGEYLIQADPPVRFGVLRELEVGLGDVILEATSRLTPTGDLEVQQRLENNTDQSVSFRCHLFVPERRRTSTQVIDLTRGEDTKTYRLSEGKSLIGTTLWLRAEEIGGSRMLNYRFVVKQ